SFVSLSSADSRLNKELVGLRPSTRSCERRTPSWHPKQPRTVGSLKSHPPSLRYTFSGSRPALAVTEIQFLSPLPPSPASRTSCWEPFPDFQRCICTIRC